MKPFEQSQDDFAPYNTQNQTTGLLPSELSFLLLRIYRFILNLTQGALPVGDPEIKTCGSHLYTKKCFQGRPGIGRLGQGKGEAKQLWDPRQMSHSRLSSICLDQVAPVAEEQSINKNHRNWLLKAHGWGWGVRYRNGSSGHCLLQRFLYDLHDFWCFLSRVQSYKILEFRVRV